MTVLEQRKYDEFWESLKEFPDEQRKAATAKAWMRWKCLTDLFYLGYEVLGLKNVKDQRGRPLVDPKFHKWLCDELQTNESVMIQLPRHHMKTTWGKIKAIQRLLLDPMNRTGYYSVTASLVRLNLRSIMSYLRTPLLMGLFPEILPPPKKVVKGRPSSWQKADVDYLTVYRDPEKPQPNEYQIEVYGTEAVVTGRHFDVHIYDDIINEQTVRTPEAIKKTEDWYAYMQNILEQGGQEIIIGTPYHYADIYSTIEEMGVIDRIIKRPCIEGGRPIYSYFTMKDLEKMKKRMTIREGAYIWSCQMMLNPIPREDQIFPPPQPTYTELPPGRYKRYITVDPAGTTKVYSDETAIVVAAVNELGWVYVEQAYGMKKRGEEIATKLLELNETYQPSMIGIELGLQTHLKTIIDMTRKHWEEGQRKRINLPLYEVRIDNRRSKFERVNLYVGSWLRAGKLKIHHTLRPLMRQMDNMTPNYSGKDDLVDALAMVFQLMPNMPYAHNEGTYGQIVRKDWFTVEDLRKPRKEKSWVARFAV